ncbi:MAG: methionine--tRNA ligase [Candidatus Saccharibacteria bacterium]|nr:methionine--tRNA ligase [Candidatus Saccharibacteria bacterium]
MTKKYVTTAIPYVNGLPHIGHAMDYCLADVYARYQRLIGNEVRFQTGTDEHGNKIFQKAKDLGIPVEEYVAGNAEKFREFIETLGVSSTDFIRTTDPEHERRVQEIWKRLSDHIYAASYEGWYCTGCERFVTEKECVENHGVCPDHNKEYEKLAEENYYFRIADFKDRIYRAIEADEILILPEFRKREILKLLADSPDVSISRPKSQLSWGVPVPGDDSQVMYVWLDALANYITVLGYPDQDISEWWPASVEVVGKDILRFHAIIWPAMLMALGLPLPKVLLSHGMVLSNGQKMSKSIGNVVDPMEVLEKHGLDAFRYFFLRHIDTFADSDFTWEKFEDAYNNELANDLGNLVQRFAALSKKNGIVAPNAARELSAGYCELMDNFEFSKAFDFVWEKVQGLNRKIDEEKPWSLVKTGETEKLNLVMKELIVELLNVSEMLKPFIPDTAEKIDEIFTDPIAPPETPLFVKQ